jgi:hypothetical protein
MRLKIRCDGWKRKYFGFAWQLNRAIARRNPCASKIQWQTQLLAPSICIYSIRNYTAASPNHPWAHLHLFHTTHTMRNQDRANLLSFFSRIIQYKELHSTTQTLITYTHSSLWTHACKLWLSSLLLGWVFGCTAFDYANGSWEPILNTTLFSAIWATFF